MSARQAPARGGRLVKHFPVRSSALRGAAAEHVHAVDGVSLEVRPRRDARASSASPGAASRRSGRLLVRLHEPTSGTVQIRRRRTSRALSRPRLRPYRREMQMIFQDPYASLNPRKRVVQIVGDRCASTASARVPRSRSACRSCSRSSASLPDHVNRYPHEFSGGQRQRIGVARALALSPQLIVADEPVSALDVSIQAQVVNLLDDLQDEFGLTYVFIAHDLGVVRHVSDRDRRHVPRRDRRGGAGRRLYARPVHPYTEALLSAIPVIDTGEEGDAAHASGSCSRAKCRARSTRRAGCRFHPRCRYATEICRIERPPLADFGGGRHRRLPPPARRRIPPTPEGEREMSRQSEGRMSGASTRPGTASSASSTPTRRRRRS